MQAGLILHKRDSPMKIKAMQEFLLPKRLSRQEVKV